MTSKEKTLTHINRVFALLSYVVAEFLRRGRNHDKSKFESVESEPLERMDELIAKEGNVPFGSPEYEERKKLLGPMLDNHYRKNSHHPEHFKNGIDGMDLFDVFEMFVDWKAASERGEESYMNLSAACSKYNVSPQLHLIMINTANRLGWKAD